MGIDGIGGREMIAIQPLDQKNQGRAVPVGHHAHQFFQVFLASGGDRIGEKGPRRAPHSRPEPPGFLRLRLLALPEQDQVFDSLQSVLDAAQRRLPLAHLNRALGGQDPTLLQVGGQSAPLPFCLPLAV